MTSADAITEDAPTRQRRVAPFLYSPVSGRPGLEEF